MNKEKTSKSQIYFANKEPNRTLELKRRIGSMLREKRYEKNYSIKSVAKDTGISKSTISEIENGVSFNIGKIEILAGYYGLHLNEQLYSDGNKLPHS